MCGILNIKIGSIAGLVVFDFRMGQVRYLKKGSGIFAVPVARSKSERLFSAAGNTVTLRNFEKVQPEGSQVDGTKEEDHCTCSMSLILMNEIHWICPFTSCITILYCILLLSK